MRILRNILLAGLAISAIGSAAHAQASATSTTSASAAIFRPITLTKNTDLRFGTVVRPASGSDTVLIAAADGTRTLQSGNAVALSSGTAPGRATFSVAGEGGQAFSIAVPATFTMTRTGGSETLTISLAATATSGTLSGALGDSSSGTASFGVGGSMPITNSTASGAYQGSFVTTVSYN